MPTLPPATHPATAALLRYFRYDHLAPVLRTVSKPFAELADQLAGGELGELAGPELTVALRKLLEAKDCSVRAALDNIGPDVRLRPGGPPEPAGQAPAAVDAATIYGQREDELDEPVPVCPICGARPDQAHDGEAHRATLDVDRRDVGNDARAKQEPGQ